MEGLDLGWRKREREREIIYPTEREGEKEGKELKSLNISLKYFVYVYFFLPWMSNIRFKILI